MSETIPPELLPDGRAKAQFLIPLWTWLTILTVTIAVYFHGASQGAPWQVSFGATLTDPDKVRGHLAGLWGVPFLGLAAFSLYRLTLQWMDRFYTERTEVSSRWERLPAPTFWLLPTGDSVVRTLRAGVWVLVLLMVPFSLGHLARKHFKITFYERCVDPSSQGCEEMPVGPAPKEGIVDSPEKKHFRKFAEGNTWERFRDHVSPAHLRAKDFWGHTFYAGGPSYLTYFPGPQAWAYLLLIAAVCWLWLRIVLSALLGRMVLRAPLATLRRVLRLELWTSLPAALETLQLAKPMIRVGLIGHRKLDPDQKRRVEEGFAEALAACAQPGYGLRVVSGMAAGADRIAIDLALKDRETELLAILPSEAQAFRDRSGVDDKQAFDVQLKNIRSKQNSSLLELSGLMPRDRDQQPEDPGHGSARIAAHRHKTSVLLRQCEFLIAAMDLADPGKPGGTRECVEEALALGTPVLVLDIDSGLLSLITRVDQLRPNGLPVVKHHEARLSDFVQSLREQLPDLDLLGHPKELGKLARVYAEAEPTALSRFSVWWKYFEYWFTPAAQPSNGSRPPPPPPNSLEAHRERITKDQRAMMAAYRGSYVLAYLLGLVAVTLALIITFVFWYSDGQAKGSMLVLAFAKLIAVGTIAWIIKRSEHDKVSELAVALRYIGERLRIMPTLAKLGSARLDLLHQTQRMGEPAKVAEDLCRRITLAQIANDLDTSSNASAALKLLQAIQLEQRGYNNGKRIRSRSMHRRLECLVSGTGKTVLLIIVADIVLLIYKLNSHAEAVQPDRSGLVILGVVLVLLTALLPALMATANALLFQSQAEQLAEREHDLALTFEKHLKVSEALEKDIAKGDVAQPVAAAVLIEAERSAAVLAEEVAEWAVMSKQSLRDV